MTTNDAAFAAARARIPGGVNSPVRAYRAVGGTPRFLASGSGATVTDVEGREYVDLVCGWGSLLLGHAHPRVVAAVREAAGRGLGFGAPTPGETALAEEIASRVAPAERVRLVSTGTEATMTAVRVARAATGRDLIVKFAGHYHGHADGLLARAGSGSATLGVPESAGVPEAVAAQTVVLPYNDRAALDEAFAQDGDRIAAVITEAAAANMGVVPPEPGFTAAVADASHAHGALLILDEVLTGFRAGPRGQWGLDAAAPETAYVPDVVTFGKVIGGGLPVAAVAGRADLIGLLAPEGPVYQAGTLSGNPVGVAAGLATLRHATAEAYARLSDAADAIAVGLGEALDAVGLPHRIQRAGTLFSVFLGEDAVGGVRDYDAVLAADTFRYPPFFQAMLEAGVLLPPSAFEAWFVSAAHDDDAVARVVESLPRAARAAAGAKMGA